MKTFVNPEIAEMLNKTAGDAHEVVSSWSRGNDEDGIYSFFFVKRDGGEFMLLSYGVEDGATSQLMVKRFDVTKTIKLGNFANLISQSKQNVLNRIDKLSPTLNHDALVCDENAKILGVKWPVVDALLKSYGVVSSARGRTSKDDTLIVQFSVKNASTYIANMLAVLKANDVPVESIITRKEYAKLQATKRAERKANEKK